MSWGDLNQTVFDRALSRKLLSRRGRGSSLTAMPDTLSSRGPAVGFLETSSIAKGIDATDAMMKQADVELLMTTIVPRGKYLIMIGGMVADVESSMRAGRETAGAAVVDEFVIQNAHPQLPAAIRGGSRSGPSRPSGSSRPGKWPPPSTRATPRPRPPTLP